MKSHGRRKFIVSIICIISCYAYSYTSGTGDVNDPFVIADNNDLLLLIASPADWDSAFILHNDLGLSDVNTLNPIGWFNNTNDKMPFTGIFDGNGHTIHSFQINSASQSHVALFGFVTEGSQPAVIKNLTIADVNIIAPSAENVASLVGRISSGQIVNCHVINSYANGENKAGLLAGSLEYSSVENSSATGIVDGNDFTGGLAGRMWFSQCDSSYAAAQVTGNINCGGLTGHSYWSNVSNCYFAGTVTAAQQAGGFIGFSAGNVNTPQDCRNCYCRAEVIHDSNDANTIGPFIGVDDPIYPTDVNNCFYDANMTDVADNGLASPLTSEQIFQTDQFLAANWDLNSDSAKWLQRDGYEPPRLKWQKYLTGDIAGDLAVNDADFALLAQNWLVNDPDSAFTADMDMTGTVDYKDLKIMLDRWLQSKSHPADI